MTTKRCLAKQCTTRPKARPLFTAPYGVQAYVDSVGGGLTERFEAFVAGRGDRNPRVLPRVLPLQPTPRLTPACG